MKKNLLAMLATAFLFSCATDPVKEEPVVKKPITVPVDKKNGESKLIEMKPSIETKPETIEPVKTTKYNALDAAIASGSDERIKAASVDILQDNPRDVKSLNALAMNSYKKGQYEASVLLLDKVLSIDPNSSTAYSNLGLVHLARNEKNEAIDYFKKSLDLDSSNVAAASNLGALYLREKDYSKAVSLLGSSAESVNANEVNMTNYAIALSAVGKPKEAADVYNKVLKKNPSNKYAMMNLAIVLIDKLNKFEDGLDLINRLKFVASDLGSRQVIKDLEIKAKAGLK